MTVKELIEKLQQFDPNETVWMRYPYDEMYGRVVTLYDVEFRKDMNTMDWETISGVYLESD